MALLQTDKFDGITEDLLEYISTHCNEKLEMTKIAAMCHYNPSYFSRAFKSFSGTSFTSFLKKARMKRAMQLLESTGMRVHDICHEVGYTDTTKFFKDFREHCGMTPHAYRKSMIP